MPPLQRAPLKRLLTCPRSNTISRSSTASPVNGRSNAYQERRNTRSRASSINDRFGRIDEDEPLEPPLRPTISRISSGANSPRKELPGFDLPTRPGMRSTSTPGFEGPMSLGRAESPVAGMPRLARVPTEPSSILGARSNLRITRSRESSQPPPDVFGDEASDYSESPSVFDERARNASWSTAAQDGGSTVKKAPPPPPPSRASKPKPPPPPMKRSALSTSEVPHY